MNLQNQLQLKISNTPLKDIALLMGYSPKHADKASQRIQRVIDDPDLGLDAGAFDLKYSDEEFLKKLIQILEMDSPAVSREIEQISDDAFEIRMLYKPWMWIDTGFKRTHEPIFVLAFIEHFRRMPIPETAGLPLDEQIERVKNWIVSHYQENDGKLFIWGNIKKYWFHYGEDQVIAFSPDGTVLIGESDAPFQLATLRV
jgi:hypothetical protein